MFNTRIKQLEAEAKGNSALQEIGRSGIAEAHAGAIDNNRNNFKNIIINNMKV